MAELMLHQWARERIVTSQISEQGEPLLDKRKVICSWCAHEVEYSNASERERADAWKIAMEHDQKCEKNPLVVKIRALEGAAAQAHGVPEPTPGLPGEVIEVLTAIQRECSLRLATLNQPARMIGFQNIERQVAKLLPR